ncbi:hypothetical protein [Falsiroseomonas tokyonensis]|uniref:Uncharacterized protein n=1 Tax=Falsiroseomonas tokyonensis TaxID=430521 RepID=A0ABV7BZ28_9PROT|nr:hypothetical protein [Falsiroseomonas tokyonensis]MBU8539448.1 hypothetical protein [Falsiroseomonas tokyonensis]
MPDPLRNLPIAAKILLPALLTAFVALAAAIAGGWHLAGLQRGYDDLLFRDAKAAIFSARMATASADLGRLVQATAEPGAAEALRRLVWVASSAPIWPGCAPRPPAGPTGAGRPR